MYNLPNILTISRIVVIPAIFLSVYITSTLWAFIAAVLFIVASITDYFDGYLARARGETSAFGRLLDPIADKLLVTSALVVLLAKPDMVVCKLSFIPVIVILCREILVSGLREFLREVNVGMPVTRLAKWKTGFQMTALSMMLLKGFWYWGEIGEFLLWIAGVLTFITGYQYFQKSLDYICETEKCAKMPVMPKITLPKIDVNLEIVKQKAEKVVAKKVTSKKTTAKKTAAKTKGKTAKTKKAAPAKKNES